MPDIPASRERFARHDAFNVGDCVQSTYARRWYGVIVAAVPRSDGKLIARVQRVCIQDGRPFRKPTTVILDPAWLRKVKALPLRDGAERA